MGLEYISQPQVFLSPISAFGGIQTSTASVNPEYYTSFYTWTSTSSVTATTFPLTGAETLTDLPGSFIVTVGGVLQAPTNYTIDKINRQIVFNFNVNSETPIVVTQIGSVGTVALGSFLVNDLTATNATIVSSSFIQDTQFNRVTASDFVALTSTLLNLQTVIVPTTSLSLTAINALFLGPVSATNNVIISNNLTVTGNITSASLNATQQLLSANIDLLNIFITKNLSANWQSTYETVSTLSASWEESADILPTVTNYLSTSNVQVSGLSIESLAVVTSNVFQTTTLANLVSALAITVNGNTVYLPLLSAI
jgi:hypothetical protein